MSGERALPAQASLRYLKLAAKRRHAAGEFPTLHLAQLAVARDNGQPSWAALRDAVAAQEAASGREGHALTQLRWIAARFAAAGEPGWLAPGEEELREHFTARFLTALPPDRLVERIAELAPVLRAELTVITDAPFTVRGQLAGHLVAGTTEARPPYRLTGVQARRLGAGISASPAGPRPTATAGPVPGRVPALAESAADSLGLVGVALAGASAPGPSRTGDSRAAQPWTAALGWADLERRTPLRADHVFPAFQVTTAVTAVTVLCLAAAGDLRLDERANRYLGGVRLADDAVTVRDLLTHTAGVLDPPDLFGPAVPALTAVTGPVIACTGKRGPFGFSHAGYAALGAIISERTGLSYPGAVARLVLRPLGLDRSWFPAAWPPAAPADETATGYDVTAEGTLQPVDRVVCAFPAAGGLWATAADLVRFGLGWTALLPRSLATQATRPHAVQPTGVHVGLGWAVNETLGLTGLVGDGPGGAASLLVAAPGRRASVALVNRQVPVEPVNAAVLRLFSDADAGLH